LTAAVPSRDPILAQTYDLRGNSISCQAANMTRYVRHTAEDLKLKRPVALSWITTQNRECS
jgi:hypothetical protein